MHATAERIDPEPLPIPARGRWVPLLEQLDIGRSLSAPLTDESALRSAASRHGTATGRRYRVVRLRKDGVIRCWRVA